MMFQNFIYLFLAFVSILYLIFRLKRRRLYELASKIPGFEGIPFFGELLEFSNLKVDDYAKKLLSYCNSKNKITKGWFGPLLVVLTDDADCIHTILNSPKCLHKPSYFYNAFYMDHGLLASNGEENERHRKILNKSFTVSVNQKMLPTFNEKSKKCVEKLRKHLDSMDFNVFEYIGICTMESFCTGHFNYDKDLYDNDFIHLIEQARPLTMRRMFSPWYNFKPLYKISSLGRTLEGYYKIMLDYIEDMQNINKMSPNVSVKDTVINLLMDPSNKFSKTELCDEMATFIFAGYEAMTISLSSVLLMLAMHKDVQQRVIEEVDEVIASTDEIDSDNLMKLTYLEMVIKETLRLFTPGGILGREVTDEMELGGYKIPKGTTLVLNIHGMQRSEKYWGNDAHLFKPERFEAYNVERINMNAFEPFSGGKRICIGYKYAMNFMKVFLVNFIKSYKVDTKLKYEEIKVDMMLTMIIAQRYFISIKKR